VPEPECSRASTVRRFVGLCGRVLHSVDERREAPAATSSACSPPSRILESASGSATSRCSTSPARGQGTDVLWLCGQAANAPELVDRFDAYFLLDIDPHVMRRRMIDTRRGNDSGEWVTRWWQGYRHTRSSSPPGETVAR